MSDAMLAGPRSALGVPPQENQPEDVELGRRAETGALPEPTLFVDLVESGPGKARPRRRIGLVPLSVGIHAVFLALAVLVPLLSAETLPLPSSGVRAFFVEPAPVAPPPPPPPAPSPARRAAPKIRPKPVEVAETPSFVAPIEVPEEIVPEEGLGFDDGLGVAGGVEGGVPGGVVGGIVGGLESAAPPPPSVVRVGGDVLEPKKLKHVDPVYPEYARQARVRGVVILECLVDPGGRVVSVKVLRGIPMLDRAATDAVRQWVYTPTLIDGVPTPVIMTVTVRFDIR